LELEALKKAAAEFNALGATFIAVSPQLQTFNRQLREEKKLTFEILSDPGNQVAQRYGLKFQLPEDLREVYLNFDIDLPRYNGDDSWTLPLPTSLIIDQNGIIQHGAINADYTVRPDPEETVAALRKIVEGKSQQKPG
jgi:peroxiredoxin